MADFGTHYKLLINEVEAFEPTEAAPNLPVARVLWKVKPNFHDGVGQWIQTGGASYGCFVEFDDRTDHYLGEIG